MNTSKTTFRIKLEGLITEMFSNGQIYSQAAYQNSTDTQESLRKQQLRETGDEMESLKAKLINQYENIGGHLRRKEYSSRDDIEVQSYRSLIGKYKHLTNDHRGFETAP